MANENKDVIRVHDTAANLPTTLRNGQAGWETTNDRIGWKRLSDGTMFYFESGTSGNYLKTNGTNSPSAEIDWDGQNLVNLGDVAIGVASATAGSVIHAKGTTTTVARLQTGANGGGAYLHLSDESDTAKFSVGYDDTSGNFYISAAAGYSTQRVVIDSNGYVGVGTTDPDGFIHIQDGSAGTVTSTSQLTIESNSSTNIQMLAATNEEMLINFGDENASNIGHIKYDNDGDYMSFRAGGTDHLRITSAGRLGLGTTSPTGRAHISGAHTAQTGLMIDPDLTLSGVTSASLLDVGSSGSQSITTEDNTVTYTMIAGTTISEPIISKGASDTITATATLHIPNAADEGTNNYGFLCEESVYIDSYMTVTGTAGFTGLLSANGGCDVSGGALNVTAQDMDVCNGLIFADYSASSVGFGTLSPSSTYRVHVVGGVSCDWIAIDGSDGGQQYILDIDGNDFHLEGQSTDTPSAIRLETKSGDAGDDCLFKAYGKSSGADVEYLEMGWDQSAASNVVRSSKGGSGTLQDLMLECTANAHLLLTTDGEIQVEGDIYYNSGAGHIFGEIYASGNSTATTIIVQNTWYQVQIFDTNGQNNGDTPDHTNDHITASKTGIYDIHCRADFTGGASERYEFKLYKNNGGTAFDNCYAQQKIDASQNNESISFSGFVSVTAADTLELWVRNIDGTSNLTIINANLKQTLIGG